MADTAVLETVVPQGPPDDPGTRGSLTVAERVAERIAARAALDVPGVVPLAPGREHRLVRRLPRADARVSGAWSRIDVEIAVAWPAPLPQVTAQVRAAVADAIEHALGHRPQRVDVSVGRVVPPIHDERRVR